MRQNSYLSHFKESLFDFLKTSNSSSTLDEDKQNSKRRTYRDILKKKLVKKCEVVEVEVRTQSSLTLPFATYIVEISCGKVQYRIEKRFSDFWNFYQNNQINNYVGSTFPEKKYIRPSWTQSITQHRASCFNDLMKQILYFVVDEELVFYFYEFIELYEHLKQTIKGSFHESDPQQEYMPVDTFLVNKIEKINEDPDNILEVFAQIKNRMANHSQRIHYDIAKQCLLGTGSNYGLLGIVLDNVNQLIVREGVQLILSMIEPETNRDYQMFVKALCKCQPHQLMLSQYELNGEDNMIKIRYFQLLRYYLSIRDDVSIFNIFEDLSNGQKLGEEYEKWIKVRHYSRHM